jgi:hypothetical protein
MGTDSGFFAVTNRKCRAYSAEYELERECCMHSRR